MKLETTTSLGKSVLVTGPIPLNIYERRGDGEVSKIASVKTKVPPQRGDILHLQLNSDKFVEYEVLQIIHGYEQSGEEIHFHLDAIVCDSSLMALLCAEMTEEVH